MVDGRVVVNSKIPKHQGTAMPLTAYRSKRSFTQTCEPVGRVRRTGHKQILVVQKHDASRLHYDLRLAVNEVLASWAGPKGPSMNPADKCLAIRTEDHPLQYAKFEGMIPSGQYGAGTVMVWDLGNYQLLENRPPEEQLASGKIHILLLGEKTARRVLVSPNPKTIYEFQPKGSLVAHQKSRRVCGSVMGHRERAFRSVRPYRPQSEGNQGGRHGQIGADHLGSRTGEIACGSNRPFCLISTARSSTASISMCLHGRRRSMQRASSCRSGASIAK